MEVIDRHRLEELVQDGAQLVEVLPPHQYEHTHLPDAISLPYKSLDPDTIQVLDRDRPVITYCSGFL
ncbi:MAG: rhodanese-like domain-containing protein [Nitriliruptorales bacterium]|nr:rhodanese-like domain-containing protein [Nitriliruptorales bacterium]